MAVKTEQEIERDFFVLVKQSELGKAIRGEVYRSEMRPLDANTEDIVIKFLSGLDNQIQTGVVIINVYVPDIVNPNGRKCADLVRIGELEQHILSLRQELNNEDYCIINNVTPTTMSNREIEQHFIYLRIEFKRLT